MAEDECLFCRIAREKTGIFYENELFYAQFDKFPISPGHAEVIPKRHAVSLFELSFKEWELLKSSLEDTVKVMEYTDLKRVYEDFIELAIAPRSVEFCQKMLGHIGMGKRPDGYNFGNNDGEAAGRTIHHLHIHVIPRYFGDVADPRGGIRYIIPELANYKK